MPKANSFSQLGQGKQSQTRKHRSRFLLCGRCTKAWAERNRKSIRQGVISFCKVKSGPAPALQAQWRMRDTVERIDQ